MNRPFFQVFSAPAGPFIHPSPIQAPGVYLKVSPIFNQFLRPLLFKKTSIALHMCNYREIGCLNQLAKAVRWSELHQHISAASQRKGLSLIQIFDEIFKIPDFLSKADTKAV